MVTVPLTAGTDLHTVEEFKQLVVRRSGDSSCGWKMSPA